MGIIKKLINTENENLEKFDTYQFEYVESKKVVHGYDDKVLRLENHISFKCFKLPEGMTEEEAYNVLSYIYKQTTREIVKLNDANLTKERIIKNVNANLCDFGFVEAETTEDVKKLYLVQANSDWKLQLSYTYKGESWYNSTVEEDYIEEVYSSLGLNLPQVQIVDDETVVISTNSNLR